MVHDAQAQDLNILPDWIITYSFKEWNRPTLSHTDVTFPNNPITLGEIVEVI